MTAVRRTSRRVWGLMALHMVASLSSCTPARTRVLNQAAATPNGIELRFTVDHPDALRHIGAAQAVRFHAELIAMQPDGLLVWVLEAAVGIPAFHLSRLALIDHAVLADWRVDLVERGQNGNARAGPTVDLRNVDDRTLLEGWARYPTSLTDELVERVRAAYQAPHIVRIGVAPPGAPPPTQPSPRQRVEGFIDEVRLGAARFRERARAVQEGYRRVGPDFPGMGEHWVQLSRVAAGGVDPSAPPILTYLEIDGRPVLTGVAFAVALGPGEAPPETPAGPGAWHDHADFVDEEALILDSRSSAAHGHEHRPGATVPRLSMLHVWTEVETAAGPFEQNNWALPYLRLGLEPPEDITPGAARALSLLEGGGRYYRNLLVRATAAGTTDAELIGQMLDRAVTRVRALARNLGAADDTPSTTALASAWNALWHDLDQALSPDARVRLERLALDWR